MTRNSKFPAKASQLLLLLFFILCIVLIFKYVQSERQRDLAGWHSRLGMLADLHRAALEAELNNRREQLRELAENPSLQLYLTQYSSTETASDVILSAQQSHIRNLIAATGERLGFNLHHDTAVNLATTTEYGIAVAGQQGNLLIASKGLMPTSTIVDDYIKQTLTTGTVTLIDIFNSPQGQPVYGYVMPVFHIQREQFTQPIGAVYVLLDPRSGLYQSLHNSQLDTHSDDSILLRLQNRSVIFISPLQQPFSLFHQLVSDAQLAEVISAQQAGSFIQAADYRGQDVIATTRAIRDTPWLLLQKIDSAEALTESNQHQQFLIVSFLLLTGLICATFIAIWRHSTSKRLQALSASLTAQTALLNAVSDNIQDPIFLLNEQRHFVFANMTFAKQLQLQPAEIIGRSLANVLGHDMASQFDNPQPQLDSKPLPDVITLAFAEHSASYHVSSARLPQGQYQNATLFVLHDVTELKAAQDKRERLAQGIIGTLVKAVDLHDPYCVNHSDRTREVALCIASELKLEPVRRNALAMAAILANIGKLFLPREILTKMEPLSESENEMLKWHINYAVDILKQLDFTGPVVTIIAQKNERLDGSGYPLGLRADDILLESRILAVANAFVAMASARAYRDGRSINEALDILMQQCERHYDRHVVAALFHIAENQADWRSWQSAANSPKRPLT